MRVVWRTQAVADLANLRDSIARDNAVAAARTAGHVREAVTRLATFPRQERPGRRPGTRELVVTGTPYFVAYRVRADSVRIPRILRGRRRWP